MKYKQIIICIFCIILIFISSAARSEEDSSNSGNIVLNFDDADLYEVIRTIAELLNINYIADPNIRGKVTIQTDGTLKKKDLFPVFFQILEANGLTAVKEGNLYKIDQFKESPRMPLPWRFGVSEKSLPQEERVIIQIIPLKYISVQEMTKLLTPFISAEGTVISHEGSNTLVLVDKGVNISKVLRLIRVFDVDLFEKVSHKFYRLQYLDAEEAVKTLNDITASYTAKDEVKITAIKRLNTLLVISSNPRIFEKIESFIRQMDVQLQDTESKIYIYSVKNGEAEELSDLLNSVFSRGAGQKNKKEKEKEKSAKTGEQSQQDAKKEEQPAAVKTPFGVIEKKSEGETGTSQKSDSSGSGKLREEINITPDTIRNALIIEATPRDYKIIENILERLDVLPRQVLIKVTLAEITLDGKNELGIEWNYKKGDENLSTSLLNASVSSSGINLEIGDANPFKRWSSKLSALASENKINILSSPTVLASENKEAKIDISTEVPVPSVEYKNTNDSRVIETNIQYRNTGIILSVTPHINEHGLVSMDINQEISEQSESVKVGDREAQSFYKRSVNTSLTVKDGQTIVIGGLMKETKNRGSSGLPCIGGLPVMQYFFGKETKSDSKTELIILITPQVIANLDDIDIVTEEFKNKVENIMKNKESGIEN